VLLITWNRARFLDLTLRALAETLPDAHEVLLWDNASTDDTAAVIAAQQGNRLNLRGFRSPRNIGTSGYAELALRARYRDLVEMDDDILVLPPRWVEDMREAFRVFPELGYLGLDVVQDEYTNGAKPLPEQYRAVERNGIKIEFGPVGGWAAMIPRDFYFAARGWPFRPHKPFFSEDGYFNRSVLQHNRQGGILAGVRAYHATGPAWNHAMGYGKLLEQKLNSPGACVPDSGVSALPTTIPDLSVIERFRSSLLP
jgi:glycosyltransferase involved in cell wall biosynthesis